MKASERGIKRALGVTERSLGGLERRWTGWEAYLGYQEWKEQLRMWDLVMGGKGSSRGSEGREWEGDILLKVKDSVAACVS